MQLFHPPERSERASFGLLVLRLVFGLAFVLHGASKAARPMSWAAKAAPGIPGWLQLLVVVAEGGGGLLLLFGALTPVATLLIAIDMVGAFLTSTLPHGGVVFVDERAGAVTYEKNAVYLAVAACLFFAGPGRYSLDALIGARSQTRQGSRAT